MKSGSEGAWGRRTLTAGALAVATAFGAGSALAISQSGEQRNMQLVGHADLQGRGSYQPNVIVYPDGRTIAFAGLHNAPNLGGAPGPLPNPLKAGSPLEDNGVMIIDVTDPTHPVQKYHIPVPVTGGQSQSVRMCLGSVLPHGTAGHVYLLRNVQGSAAQMSGYEVWDVTNVSAPVLASAMRGLRSTHKMWWECNTGIAYMPGSKAAPAPLWRQSQSMVIVDWSNPNAAPIYIRTYGLVGGQPGGTGPVPTSLHGAISAHEHPNAAGTIASGADVIGNRVYAAYGVGSDGVMQILDRKKLLTPAYGGTFTGNPDSPTVDDLIAPQVGRLTMSPDQGGHTSMPVFGLAPRSLQDVPQKRDIVMLASEAGDCTSHNWSFAVDVTTENSIGVRQDPWQGPMVLSTLWVDPHSGAKFPRGDYCFRGQRFGVHSSEENFRNPYYGKLNFTSYFNAGVRTWDIRDPQGVVEVGFYVPAAPNNTYMTNNVEVDNRGYIYIVDRIGNGMDILKLTGCASHIVDKGSVCNGNGDDNGDGNGRDD
jgi:LVIVD repeat